MIIDGRKISAEILQQLKKELAALSFRPKLVDVLVGDDPVTESYVRIKSKRAAEIGVDFEIKHFPNTITQQELEVEIEKINQIENIRGLIVQLPLPEHLDKQKILDQINPKIDVDMICSQNANAFYNGTAKMLPPTAAAVIGLLESVEPNLEGKNILVIGAGDLVGKPSAFLLKQKGAIVTVADKETADLITPAQQAEIIVSGTGVAKLIGSNMVNSNSIVIDAGTAESAGGIAGDADFEAVKDLVKAISPVPGGVGPLTVAMLLKNVVIASKSVN
ncbi:MAG: Bifunctional protein folD [Candidatus Doudnabacteria bacterium]|nr:Bifunctional protein folD [Candidatus Doudnabacteria bacterium]